MSDHSSEPTRFTLVTSGICSECGFWTRKQRTFGSEAERDAWVPDYRHEGCKVAQEKREKAFLDRADAKEVFRAVNYGCGVQKLAEIFRGLRKESGHRLGKVHGGRRYCMDRDCNYGEDA